MATIYWQLNRRNIRQWQPGAYAYLNWWEGRQVRLALGQIDPGEAEAIRAAKEAELRFGVAILPRLPKVADFLERYQEWYAAEHPTTADKLKSELKAFVAKFGQKSIETIRPLEVEQWKAARLKTHAPETVGKELRRLKAAFKRGMMWREIDVNPVDAVTAPRGVHDAAVLYYTPADIQKLYEASKARASLWALMVNTGIRRKEMAKATKDDVTVYGKGKGAERRLRIESTPDRETGQGRTKSGRWREVPLNSAALAAIAALPDRLAGGVHFDTLSDWFAVDAKAAGIGGSLHRLRHTFCSHLSMAGVSLRRIQLLAGHSDLKQTERYAHLAPSKADDAVGLLDFAPKAARKRRRAADD